VTQEARAWIPSLLRDASTLLAAARIGAGDPEISWAISTAQEATEAALRAFDAPEPAEAPLRAVDAPEPAEAPLRAVDAPEPMVRAEPTLVQRYARAELEEPRRKFDPEAARRRAAEAI
jgi:hypothetical protein